MNARRLRALQSIIALAVFLALGAVFGFSDGDGGTSSPAAERWRTLARSTVARTEVAAARIGDGAYVVGGFAAPGGATTDIVERYDLRLDRWARVAPIPQAVNHAAAVAYDGDLYVAGGYTAVSGLAAETNALWRYEPGADRWTRLRGAPTARGAIAAATVNGRIVVVGGEENAGTIAEVESFDPRTRRWRSEPRLKTPRHGLGAISHRGRVVVLEGGPTPGLDYSDVTEALRVPR